MSGLGLTFLRRGGQAHPTAGSDYILSESRGDAEVFRILMSKGVSSDGVGITKEDAARVTSLSTWFQGNTKIVTFDELRFFTNVKTLENGAFRNCSALVSIDVTNVQTLYDNVFYGCNLQTSEMILPNATRTGQNTFAGLTAEAFIADALLQLPAGSSGVNYGKKANLLRFSAMSATYLTISALQGYSALTSIALPWARITYLGEKALYQCTGWQPDSIRFESLATYGRNALYKVKVKTLYLGGTMTSLPTAASSDENYGDKTIVTTIEVNAPIAEIPAYSFYGYKALTELVLSSNNVMALANANALTNTNNCPIYVPDALVDSYKAAANWTTYASRIKGISEYQG